MTSDLKRLIDLNVTSGLGYEKIKHFEDSEVGLVRHLRMMGITKLWSDIKTLTYHIMIYTD